MSRAHCGHKDGPETRPALLYLLAAFSVPDGAVVSGEDLSPVGHRGMPHWRAESLHKAITDDLR